MSIRKIVFFCIVVVCLCGSHAMATDWIQQYRDNGKEVVRISSDVLYDYGPSYVGQTVVTTFTVKEKSSDCLKCDTSNNESMSFSIVAYFNNSEINNVAEGQKVIVIGTVDEFGTFGLFGSEKTVNLKNCHLVTEGITVQEIESTKEEQIQEAKENEKAKILAAEQAVANDNQMYMDKCEVVNYKDVERNPNMYKNRNINRRL